MMRQNVLMRVRESPEDAAGRSAPSCTCCYVWLGGGRRPSGCQPTYPILGVTLLRFILQYFNRCLADCISPCVGVELPYDNSTLY